MSALGLWAKVSVELPQKDEIIMVGPHAELLYIRGLLFCKRALTDGHISRRQLPAVGRGIPAAKRQAAALVSVGLWEETDDGWVIPSWLLHNSPKKAVAEISDTRSAVGKLGNHKRHHVGAGGRPSDDCSLCQQAGLVPSQFATETSQNGSQTTSTETETETETEIIHRRRETHSPRSAGRHDDDGSHLPQVARDALEFYADHKLTQRTVKDPVPYRAKVIRNATAEHGPNLLAFLEGHPTADARTLAMHVLGLTELNLYRIGAA